MDGATDRYDLRACEMDHDHGDDDCAVQPSHSLHDGAQASEETNFETGLTLKLDFEAEVGRLVLVPAARRQPRVPLVHPTFEQPAL